MANFFWVSSCKAAWIWSSFFQTHPNELHPKGVTGIKWGVESCGYSFALSFAGLVVASSLSLATCCCIELCDLVVHVLLNCLEHRVVYEDSARSVGIGEVAPNQVSSCVCIFDWFLLEDLRMHLMKAVLASFGKPSTVEDWDACLASACSCLYMR